jgi:hypothetical protein
MTGYPLNPLGADLDFAESLVITDLHLDVAGQIDVFRAVLIRS